MTVHSLTHQPTFRIGPFTKELVIIGLLASLTLIGAVAGLGRLFAGLAATTALSDSYPWGIWIGFDFTLIAVAGVGFTMAFVVHVLHRHELQAVLRPALWAGLMGYTAVLLLLVLDLGRPDRFYHFLLYWNLHSPLFEISWCVLLYTTVLLIEVSPDLLRWLGWSRLLPWVARLMTPVTILGVTLSTLHQSTLGTLYLNMPHRLDPLWYTPYLPLLFLVSAVMMGFSLGLLAYQGACHIHEQRVEPRVIATLGKGMTLVAMCYLALKLIELAWIGELSRLTVLNRHTLLFSSELLIGVVLPVMLWWWPGWRRHAVIPWAAPLLVLLGVALNRFNATMFAQAMPANVIYSPHILEWLSTIGIVAGATLGWYIGVRYLVRKSHWQLSISNYQLTIVNGIGQEGCMQQLEAGLIVLGLFLVRLGIPLAVIAAVSYWLRRVDARWAAEASAYQRSQAWVGQPLTLSVTQKPAIDPPCWERRGCSPFQQAQCAAGQQPCLPCWLARLRQEGRLPSGCTTCALFALPVRPPVAAAGD